MRRVSSALFLLTSSEPLVSFREADYGWGQPLLEGISFKVKQREKKFTTKAKPGEFLTIAGPTASGKTCLAGAILGKIPKLSGDQEIRGTIAYVPQKVGAH